MKVGFQKTKTKYKRKLLKAQIEEMISEQKYRHICRTLHSFVYLCLLYITEGRMAYTTLLRVISLNDDEHFYINDNEK